MTAPLTVARSELILGGQKSGKSRRAEALAQHWLAQSASHEAVLIATAQPWDDEMRERIARHQRDRAERLPGMRTVEAPLQLAQAIAQHSRPDILVVVDCLTLWLTNWLMPVEAASNATPAAPSVPSTSDGAAVLGTSAAPGVLLVAGQGATTCEKNQPLALVQQGQVAMLLKAIEQAAGPLVLVGNEIGLGVIPLGREVRDFVDALGLLNQSVAQVCQRVTLMAAGLPLSLKETS